METDHIIPYATRATVWDPTLFKNDKDTPNCWRRAMIVRVDGKCCDVIFDYKSGIVSRGHFISGIRIIHK